MQGSQPSRTAIAAAMYRAAHQELDESRVFADPYALAIIGGEAARERALELGRARPAMRAFIAQRSAIAEARLANAVQAGVRQVVVLGAGLDTLSLRNPHPKATLFEVDHPATQAWKREQLASSGLTVGDNVRFVPVDFEQQSLSEQLLAAGFDIRAQAFYMWLGVVPYLTDTAAFATLEVIAKTPSNEAVFDYANPVEQLDPLLQDRARERAARVAAIGEPFQSAFDTTELHARLRSIGALDIDDWGPLRLAALHDKAALSDAGGHILWVRF